MKRLIVALTVLTAACSSNSPARSSLTAPTADNSIVYDSSVQWDPTQIGRVTVTNPRTTPLTLTFMLWNRISEFNQVSIGAAVYTLAPKETRVLTVGATLACGATVQRDLYEGSFNVGTTLSDVGNVLYAGDARTWPADACKVIIPPPPPPDPKCTDPNASNVGQPLPCIVLPPCKPYGTSTHGKPKPCEPVQD